MLVDAQAKVAGAEAPIARRTYRDEAGVARIDKGRVLAHLRAQLAELEASKETPSGDA